jgi:RND family efflux transporter MFP subunit
MKVGYGRLVVVLVVLALLIGAGAFVGRRYMTRQAGSGSDAAAAVSTGAAGGGVALASSGKQGEPAKAPVPVSVRSIGVGPVSSYLSSTANLVPENEVKVLAEAEGRVAELHVEEGSRVEAGQVLATLAHDDAEITLKKAQFKAVNARLAYERAGKMAEESLVSREVFDRVKMDDEISRQELAEAEWRFSKTLIRAPFGGRVTVRDIKPGQHVRPGDPLFTVSDFDPLTAKIYLPEKDVLGLREGRQVRITLKADDTTRFAGRISRISPVVDTATGTVKVTIEAAAVPAEVRPGAFVTIEIVRETRPAATLLPREAVVRDLQDTYVFVVDGEVAKKRAVTLGMEEGNRIEAISGVTAGERVITAGQGGLKEGSPIKIIPASEASSDLVATGGDPLRG